MKIYQLIIALAALCSIAACNGKSTESKAQSDDADNSACIDASEVAECAPQKDHVGNMSVIFGYPDALKPGDVLATVTGNFADTDHTNELEVIYLDASEDGYPCDFVLKSNDGRIPPLYLDEFYHFDNFSYGDIDHDGLQEIWIAACGEQGTWHAYYIYDLYDGQWCTLTPEPITIWAEHYMTEDGGLSLADCIEPVADPGYIKVYTSKWDDELLDVQLCDTIVKIERQAVKDKR